jgi:Zn-finger nucleic acid-binding protein
VYRTVSHHCPECQIELEHGRSKYGSPLEMCPTCRGIWIAPKTFFESLRRALPNKRIDELMVHNDGTPRRPCPHCLKRMNIAWLDFLPLDQCEEHGVWLDPGEFEIALTGEFSPRVMPKELSPRAPASSNSPEMDASTWVVFFAG